MDAYSRLRGVCQCGSCAGYRNVLNVLMQTQSDVQAAVLQHRVVEFRADHESRHRHGAHAVRCTTPRCPTVDGLSSVADCTAAASQLTLSNANQHRWKSATPARRSLNSVRTQY